MSATRIRVDFNSRAGGGLVRSSIRRADAPVKPGDRVIAYQPGEDMERFGTVVDLDAQSGRLTIDVDWSSQPVLAKVPTGRNDHLTFVMSQPAPYRLSLSEASAGSAMSAPPTTAPQLVNDKAA